MIARSLSRFALIAAVCLSLGACSSTPRHQSAGERLDDAGVTASVKARIVADPALSVAEINVKTFKGVTQLSGFVLDNESRERAVELARATPGVMEVRNEMRLKGSADSSAGSYLDDTAITAKVKAALLARSPRSFVEVKVETYHGVTQLSGFVTDAEQRRDAVEIARTVSGVRSVKDDMDTRGR